MKEVGKNYKEIGLFHNGLAYVINDFGLMGFINTNGIEIIPCIYDEVRDFNGNVAVVKLEGEYWLINKQGNKISKKYQCIGPFIDSVACVKEDGKYGYINLSGEEIIPCKFKKAEQFSNGLAKVCFDNDDSNLGNGYGFINTLGEEIFLRRFTDASSFHDGYACCKLGEGEHDYGFIDTKGNGIDVSNLGISSSFSFNNGYAIVTNKNKLYGVIDTNGKMIIPFKYDFIRDISDGLFLATASDGSSVFLDTDGKEVLSLLNRMANPFKNARAVIRDFSMNAGIINKEGELLAPLKYQHIGQFFDELAICKKNNLFGFIDRDGKEAVPLKYLSVSKFSCGLSLVKNTQGLYGYIDKAGKEIIPCQYIKATEFSEDYACVMTKEGNWLCINKTEVLENILYKERIHDEKIKEMKEQILNLISSYGNIDGNILPIGNIKKSLILSLRLGMISNKCFSIQDIAFIIKEKII